MTYWFLSVLHSIVIGSQTVSLWRESGTKLLRNERQRCRVLLSGHINQKLRISVWEENNSK